MELPSNSEFTAEFFDQSSKAWIENKIKCGTSYVYKCIYIHSNQKQCKRPTIQDQLCKQHLIFIKSQTRFK